MHRLIIDRILGIALCGFSEDYGKQPQRKVYLLWLLS